MFTLDLIAERQTYASWADSGYLENLIANSWWDVAWQTPIRVTYFLYSPMPWDLDKATYLAGMLDGVLYLGLTLALVRAAPILKERKATWFILALVALLLVIFALNTYNAGTAVRHRTKLAPLLLMLVPAVALLARRLPDGRRLLYVVNDPSTFFPNRHALALAARGEGWEVHVAGPDTPAAAQIRNAGWTFHPVRMDRRNMAPWREVPTFWGIYRVIRQVRPQLVHAFALKPILHGGLAARLARAPGFVGTVTGLGYVFIQRNLKARLLRSVLSITLGFAYGHQRAVAIFQNADDKATFLRLGIVDAPQAQIIRGSGIDLARHKVTALPEGPPVFVLVARMLEDKGVSEFVEAARIARDQGVEARFVLVGDTDPGNPAAIQRARLESWQEEGAIEWWGHRTDMPAVYAQATVVVLPSYREGIPRALLEGASSGRPLVATDVAGCRDVCRDGVNGILVPARDPNALARAFQRLGNDPALCERLGAGGRSVIADGFARKVVERQQLQVYADVLARATGFGSNATPTPSVTA